MNVRDEWNIFSHYFVQFGNGMAFRFCICTLVLHSWIVWNFYHHLSAIKMSRNELQSHRNLNEQISIGASVATQGRKREPICQKPRPRKHFQTKWIVDCFVTFELCGNSVDEWKQTWMVNLLQSMIYPHPHQLKY